MSEVSAAHSRSQAVFVVTTTTFVLATVFVVARLISRFGIVKNKTWDDWFMILAWFLAFGLSFAIDYGTSKGLGKHDVDIPDSDLDGLHQAEYAFTILYNPALMATKTSILVFYLRMARNTQNMLRIASYVTLAVVNVAGVVLTFLNAFQCRPVTAAYSSKKIDGKCISIVTLFLCSAPVNIITDLAILILPIPVLTGMRLPQRQKTVLVFTFALGVFVTIVDVVRIYYLQQASDDQVGLTSNARLGTGTDFSWNASTALMWSAVEVNVGIICACIPTLKPLIKRTLPSMITDRSGSGSNKDTSASELRASDEPQRQSPAAAAASPPEVKPLPPAQLSPDDEQEMGFLDFLTIPGDTMPENKINRSTTARTAATQNTVYFGFIDMRRPKSMLKTKGMESFKYCTIVTILFFLWGFSYGLLNILNNEISNVANQSLPQTLGLSSAYFGAYFVGPLTVGQWTLRKSGFKATFICGLCIYGTGTLMFWPSAVLKSFPGFLICSFVVGFGLSVLETAANPFLALCGPPQYAEYRLMMAQAVQAIGTILSQLLAQKVLFGKLANSPSLIDVQWTYLAVALFVVMLALFFYYMPLPEASDADLQQLSEDLSIYPSQKIGSTKLPLIYTTLLLAVFSQFIYVAAQESHSVWFGSLLTPISSLTMSVDNYTLVGHTTFAAGRMIFAPLCLVIKPRFLLLFIIASGLLFTILLAFLRLPANGLAGPALVFFFVEGPAWPIIFAMGLRGMGRKTKWAAALLTSSASGGAVFPFVMYAVQNVGRGATVQSSYRVVVGLMAFALVFPIYLNFVPGAKWQVDPRADMQARLGDVSGHLRNSVGGGGGNFDGRPETPIRRLSRRVSVFFEKIHAGGGKSVVEHRESSGDIEVAGERRSGSDVS